MLLNELASFDGMYNSCRDDFRDFLVCIPDDLHNLSHVISKNKLVPEIQSLAVDRTTW